MHSPSGHTQQQQGVPLSFSGTDKTQACACISKPAETGAHELKGRLHVCKRAVPLARLPVFEQQVLDALCRRQASCSTGTSVTNKTVAGGREVERCGTSRGQLLHLDGEHRHRVRYIKLEVQRVRFAVQDKALQVRAGLWRGLQLEM